MSRKRLRDVFGDDEEVDERRYRPERENRLVILSGIPQDQD